MSFIKNIIFFLTIFLFFGSITIQADELYCYVVVTHKESEKGMPFKSGEVTLHEIEIELRHKNKILKNWDLIAKELGYSNSKSMISDHKEHKNWSKYKKYFNDPNKFNQAILLEKITANKPQIIDPVLVSEIAVSLIFKLNGKIIA